MEEKEQSKAVVIVIIHIDDIVMVSIVVYVVGMVIFMNSPASPFSARPRRSSRLGQRGSWFVC